MKTIIASALLAVALGVSAASAQPAHSVAKANPYGVEAQTGGDFVVVKQLDGGGA